MTVLMQSPQGLEVDPVVAAYYGLDDAMDYRVMLAREVYAEREWRINARKVTPIECAAIDALPGPTVREYVEAENGEPLA